MAIRSVPLEDRFWSKVLKTDTCWLWQRQLNNKGYGCFYFSHSGNRRNMYAHRMSWIMANGPIPAGLNVLHICDTPACVNPSHLRLGSQADNISDCKSKGRFADTRAHGAKLSEQQVRAIRNDARKHHLIAADYGVKRDAIWKIKNNRSWTFLP
jgi:hypothetical protein